MLVFLFTGLGLMGIGLAYLHIASPIIASMRQARAGYILSSQPQLDSGSQNAGNLIPMRVPATSEPAPELVPAPAEPTSTLQNEDALAWHGRVAILAAMKDDSGKLMFTPDEIVAKIGKRRADVLTQMALYRPKPALPAGKHSFSRDELEAA